MKYALIIEQTDFVSDADGDDRNFDYDTLAAVSNDLDAIKKACTQDWGDGKFGLIIGREACTYGRIVDLDLMKVIFTYGNGQWITADYDETDFILAA